MRMNLSWFRPFLIMVLVLAVPPVLYWFGYVQNSVLEAKRQGHATLSAVTTEFRARIFAHDQIAQTTELNPWTGQFTLEQYLKSVLQPRSMSRVGDAQYHLEVGSTGGALNMNVKVSDANVLRALIPVDNLVPWNVVESDFDGLLVLTERGELLAQDRRLPSQPLGAVVALKRDEQAADFAKLAGSQTVSQAASSRNLTDKLGFNSPFDLRDEYGIQIAGVDYLALIQPVTVMTTRIGPAQGYVREDTRKLTLLVSALIRKDRLRREAIELGPQTLIVFGAFVLLGAFTIPFLKLRFIGERERMQPRDVWLLSGSMLCATAVLTLLIHDKLATDQMQDRFDAGLARLADSLRENLTFETLSSIEQLEASLPTLLAQRDREPIDAKLTPCEADKAVAFRPQGAVLTDQEFTAYPEFEAIFVTNLCGWQLHKWMTRTIPTPTITVVNESYFAPALTLTTSDRLPYAFSTTVARTSGLLLGVYAVPFDRDGPRASADVPAAKRNGVAGIATPMHSVDQPLIAAPYQFVLVDRQGAVTFQRSQGSFRGERFFEAVRGGSVLERAARAEAEDAARGEVEPARTFQYRGRAYRMQAFDVPELRQTLVVFYESDVVGALAAGMVFTTGAYSLGIVVAILLAAGFSRMLFREWAFDWAWPSPRRKILYVIGAILGVLSMLVLWGIRNYLTSLELTWFVFLAPFVVVLALGSGTVTKALDALVAEPRDDAPDPEPDTSVEWTRRVHAAWHCARIMVVRRIQTAWRHLRDALRRAPLIKYLVPRPSTDAATSGATSLAYKTFVVITLLAFVAWPTTVAFLDAYRAHAAAYQDLTARNWSLALTKRIDRGADSVVNVGDRLPEAQCETHGDIRCSAPDRLYAKDTNHGRLVRQRSDLALYYDCANLLEGFGRCSTAQRPDPPYSFTSWSTNWTTGLAKKDIDLTATLASFAAQQAFAGGRAQQPPLFAGMSRSPWALAGFALLLGSLCLLVGSIARHVLGISLTNDGLLDEHDLFQHANGSRWLLLRPSAARLAAVKQRLDVGRDVLDLRAEPALPVFKKPAREKTLLLVNIESRLDNRQWRDALLELIRTQPEGCLALVAEIDPLYYLSQRLREHDEYMRLLPESEKERRAAAKQELGEMYRERAQWAIALRGVSKVRESFSRLPMPPGYGHRDLYLRLEQECSRSPELIAIGERLLRRPDLHLHDWNDIVGFVLDGAEPYYRALWELCSREERLVMIQLAQCGLINPKRIELVRRLARRGLVIVDPRFRLMNESFERFVSTVEPREHVAEWERSSEGMAWAKLATPLYALAAIVIAILLFTEQALFSSVVVMAGGAARTLGSLRGLYSSIAKPSDGSKVA